MIIIDNNEPILDFLSYDNTEKCLKSVSTYDFSNLYTSIPHTQLKDNLRIFVERVFDFKDKSYIIPNLYTKKAYFSDNVSKSKVQFSKDKLLECLNYLIDNSYVTYQGQIYRQVIGIPMGTNAAPQIANVYLHVYEYKYIKLLIEQGDTVRLARINSTLKGFKNCVTELLGKLVAQGFKLAALRNKFVKFYKSRLNIWGKYGSDIYDEFIEMF